MALVSLAGWSRAARTLEAAWSLLPDDERDYVTTGNFERGVAANPANGNVLLVSRAGEPGIYVLDGATGEEKHSLDLLDVFGGTFPVSLIGVGGDGVVYAANLSTSTETVNFKIYRWADDGAETEPTLAWEGDPAGIDDETGESLNVQRWGDTFAVFGSGAETVIVAGSRASSTVAVFTTEDGENFEPTLISGVANGGGSLGLAMGGADVVYSTLGNQPVRRAVIDVAAGSAVVTPISTGAVPGATVPIGVDAASGLMVGLELQGGADRVSLFDISTPDAAPVLLDQMTLPVDEANVNGVGACSFAMSFVYVLDTNNGLHAYEIKDSNEVLPPEITQEPADVNIIEGGAATLNVTATGTPPFTYQWSKGEAAIEGATSAQFMIAEVAEADAGEYSVTVTNEAGSVMSALATLTVFPKTQSGELEVLWTLAPGDRDYLSDDNAQRGIAYNKATGNVVLVSRTGGTRLIVLDGDTGETVRELNTDSALLTGGGIFLLSMVGVSDDGAIYAANLSLSGTDFTLYRWASDADSEAEPEIVFGPEDPGLGDRVGDSLDVRGSGAGTQIIAASRNGTNVAIFTTEDGDTFDSTVVDTEDASGGDFGLSVTFGAGDTFWGKALNRPLRQVSFDLGTGMGQTIQEFGGADFPNGVSAIAVDPLVGYLGGVSIETPDNLRLYGIDNLEVGAVLLGQEFFPTDNANGNGVGSVDFGNGRLYALDTNNGIIAATTGRTPPPPGPPLVLADIGFDRTSDPERFTATLEGDVGVEYVIESSANLVDWEEALDGKLTETTLAIGIEAAAGETYFRARVVE